MSSEVSLLKFRIIKSLLAESNEILFHTKTKLYTANVETKSWLYSEIQGILIVSVNYQTKNGKLFIFNEQDLTVEFEIDFYRNFNDAYTVFNPLFHYFEVGNGFVGLKFNSLKKSEELSKLIKSLNEKTLENISNSKHTSKVFEIEENYKQMIKSLKKKLEEEYLFKSSVITESIVYLTHSHINKLCQILNFEKNNLVVKASKIDVQKLCDTVLDVEYTDKDNLKISDPRAYALNLYYNIRNTNHILGKTFDDDLESKKSIYIDSASRHKVIPVSRESKEESKVIQEVTKPIIVNTSVPITKPVVVNTSKGIPSTPIVVTNNSKNVPNIPKVAVVVNNSKGVPGVPKLPNVISIPNIPNIPNIQSIPQPIKTVETEQTGNSNVDRLAEIQKQMGKLKKAEVVPEVPVNTEGNESQNTTSNVLSGGGKKVSMMDELKMKMMGRFKQPQKEERK